ncbi:Retrotrans-gag domain-containing protein [Mycena chlorophos]|uniref:Retrotrans-gag domain-containing protein n=1 Tax=Mycena chlorophos TaxID=658473 RepID=A0A8H6WQ91_MYCCL|nr:Retrotrans-gag domain-containing protein [Mycena chlorophos]
MEWEGTGFSSIWEEIEETLGLDANLKDAAVQFGLDQDGEVVIEAVIGPRNGRNFKGDEIKQAYLLASKDCQAREEDKEAAQLFNQFVGLEPKESLDDGRIMEVFTFDERVLMSKRDIVRKEESAMRAYRNKARNLPKSTKIRAAFATKYKPVALKVRPVYTDLPEKFRIKREIKGDPLKDMPKLPERPPDFVPTGRYTEERKAIIDKAHAGDFLTEEERKLAHEFMQGDPVDPNESVEAVYEARQLDSKLPLGNVVVVKHAHPIEGEITADNIRALPLIPVQPEDVPHIDALIARMVPQLWARGDWTYFVPDVAAEQLFALAPIEVLPEQPPLAARSVVDLRVPSSLSSLSTLLSSTSTLSSAEPSISDRLPQPPPSNRLYAFKSATTPLTYTSHWSRAAAGSQGVPGGKVRRIRRPRKRRGPKPAAYVVLRGRSIGVKLTWDETREATSGFRFNLQSGFSRLSDAHAVFDFASSQGWTSTAEDLLIPIPPERVPWPVNAEDDLEGHCPRQPRDPWYVVYVGIHPGIYPASVEALLNVLGIPEPSYDSWDTMSAEDRERSILTLLLEINGRTHAAEAGQLQLAENLGRAEVAMGDMRLQLDNADALVITLQNQVRQAGRGSTRAMICSATRDDLRAQQGAGKAASGGKQPRVAAPKDFNGDATTVDSFLADCFLNFNGNPLYAGDTAKINYALSYCKEGPAVVWKDTIVQSMRNGTGTGSFKTWKDFEDGFIATFRSPAHVELTIQKMETLRQGKGEPAMNYFTLLDSYNQVAKYDDTNLTRLLRRALDPRIIKGIYGQSTQPVTHDQWKRDAQTRRVAPRRNANRAANLQGNRAANPAVAKNNPVAPTPGTGLRRPQPREPSSRRATSRQHSRR